MVAEPSLHPVPGEPKLSSAGLCPGSSRLHSNGREWGRRACGVGWSCLHGDLYTGGHGDMFLTLHTVAVAAPCPVVLGRYRPDWHCSGGLQRSWADGHMNQHDTGGWEKDRAGHRDLSGGRGCLACELRIRRGYQREHKLERVPKKWGSGGEVWL